MAIYQMNLTVNGRSFALRYDLDAARTNEQNIIAHFQRNSIYEPDVSALAVRVLADGDLAVDVGANAGFFSVMMAALAGPKGKVVAFEPGANTLDRLRNNIQLNALENIILIERPVSDREREVVFHLNSDNSGGNALWDPAQFPGNTKSQAEPISRTMNSLTLDGFFADTGLPCPKLIKIDTEGAEQRVLEGARKLLAGAAVPFIVAELHSFGLEKMGDSPTSLRGLMEELGYSTFLLYSDGKLPKLVPPATSITAGRIINLLFSTPEQVGRHWPNEIHDPG